MTDPFIVVLQIGIALAVLGWAVILGVLSWY